MTLFCGCSGYYYKEWKGTFYPDKLPKKEWLSHYAETFDTVEINSTFYGLPGSETIRKWGEKVPAHFRFALKGSQFITHQKKLKRDDALEEALDLFFERVEPLREKTPCILWQLPRNQHLDLLKLEEFLPLLPTEYDYALEFRHPSWFNDDVFASLHEYRVACVALSTPEEDLPEAIFNTADFVYLRLHGSRAWYRSRYTEAELELWMSKILETQSERAYVYFNNTAEGHAVENSLQMVAIARRSGSYHSGLKGTE